MIAENDAISRILGWGCGMVVVTRDVHGSSAHRYKGGGDVAIQSFYIESVSLKVSSSGSLHALCYTNCYNALMVRSSASKLWMQRGRGTLSVVHF